MSSGLADEAWLGFIAALTLLLAVSLLVVIRQPPWIPPPPVEESGGQPGGPEPAERWPAYPGPSYGRHSAGPAAGPAVGPAAGRAGEPGAGQRPSPLPVRQPRHSGWPSPAEPGRLTGQESLAGPNGGQPRVTGEPPWGPAPRPPGALP